MLPLVFLHGFLGTPEDWLSVCSYLPTLECFRINFPKTRIEIPRFHLIGYSMGGRIALMYAHKHPEQIASLTLLSTHPGLKTEQEKAERLEEDRKWAKLLLELSFDEFLNRWYDRPLFKPFRPMRKEQNRELLAMTLLQYSLAHQPRFEIDGVIVGERDLKFRSLFAHPIIIPNAGHAVHLENPKAVAFEIQKRTLI